MSKSISQTPFDQFGSNFAEMFLYIKGTYPENLSPVGSDGGIIYPQQPKNSGKIMKNYENSLN